jgi:hypothetical protein
VFSHFDRRSRTSSRRRGARPLLEGSPPVISFATPVAPFSESLRVISIGLRRRDLFPLTRPSMRSGQTCSMQRPVPYGVA